MMNEIAIGISIIALVMSMLALIIAIVVKKELDILYRDLRIILRKEIKEFDNV